MDHRIAKTPLVSVLFRHGKTIPIAPAHEDPETMERAFVRIAQPGGEESLNVAAAAAICLHASAVSQL